MQDMHLAFLVAVYRTTWWLDDLPISPSLEFRQLMTAQGMIGELAHMLKDSLDQRPCRARIIQGDVVCDRLQIT